MSAGRPRKNDGLYEEIRSRIEKGESRRAVVEDVATRHGKSFRSLNSQYSVWINSRLPDISPTPTMRLVPLTAIADVRQNLETILAEAERQLACTDRLIAELQSNRQSLSTHIDSIQEAIAVTRGKPWQPRNSP